MPPKNEPVDIIGGGLIGPLLAVLLAKRGYDVRVHESREDPRISEPTGGRSTHLVVSARGWAALEAVGVAASVREQALPIAGRRVHALDGSVRFLPYGTGGQAIFAINRATLNRLLLEHARAQAGVTFTFNHRCLGVELGRGVLMEDMKTRTQREVTAPRIIGADGAFSRVRRSMLSLDRFEYSQSYVAHGYKELDIPSHAGGGHALEPDALHVWPRRNALVTAFPNLDGSFSASLLVPFEGPYPSFASLTTRDDVRRLFGELFPDAVPLMPNLDEEFFRRPAASCVTMRCFPWTYRDHVALIGDAAHAMVPFLGQGMNAGLEDCTVFDSLIERCGDDWTELFRAYENERKPNCDAVTDLSLRNFVELSELVGNPTFVFQKKLEGHIHRLFPDRFLPLYPMLAFTRLPYREVLQISAEQDVVVTDIMALPDVERRLETGEIDGEIRERAARLPRRFA